MRKQGAMTLYFFEQVNKEATVISPKASLLCYFPLYD